MAEAGSSLAELEAGSTCVAGRSLTEVKTRDEAAGGMASASGLREWKTAVSIQHSGRDGMVVSSPNILINSS